MSGYDYRQYDVRDVHEAAPRITADGFRLRLGRASGGRSGRAVPFGSFGGIVVAVAVMMAVSGPPLSLRVAAVFFGVFSVGAVLLTFAARVLFNRAEVVCEQGQLYTWRSWWSGGTRRWPAPEVEGFVAHVRRVRATETRRAYAAEHMAWSVSARAGNETLDLDLSLRPEQAERVAEDLWEALSSLRVDRANRGGFRG